MATYVARRLVLIVPILLGVSILVFLALYVIPGDALTAKLSETLVSGRDIQRLRRLYGLADPVHIQYLRFLGNALRGDLGRSIINDRPVTDQILEHLPATLELTLWAMVFAIILGLSLGVVAAIRRGSWMDMITMVTVLAGISMPVFWSGLLLIFLFALKLGWLPAAGTGGWEHVVLPAFALGFSAAGVIARITRSSTLEVLAQEHVRTARAKGLRERIVVWKHAVRNALISVVTIVGLQFGALLGGAVVTEIVFGRQGLGFLAADAVRRQDFPLIQGTVIAAALAFVLINLLVDISYAYLDPRIRYA